MDLLENEFWLLGATIRDDRRRLMSLAEEKSLLADESLISSARNVVTHPRKRLGAEIAWLPGVAPARATELVKQLQTDPHQTLEQENIPALVRANLLVAILNQKTAKHDDQYLTKMIIKIATVFDEINPEDVLTIINEDRSVSGFPAVVDIHAIESEIDNRRRYYRTVILDASKASSDNHSVKVITVVVDSVTKYGNKPAPLLIDDLVDAYEVEAQSNLDNKEETIKEYIEQIRVFANDGAADEILLPIVDQLNQAVHQWDSIAQPIQVSTKSRGLEHPASVRLAGMVRDVAIHLFNQHDKLEFSQKIITNLQKRFAEVVKVADMTETDATTLDDISIQRKINFIYALCAGFVAKVEKQPNSAYLDAKLFESIISKLLTDLQTTSVPTEDQNQVGDEIAISLLHCATIIAKQTGQWIECPEILTLAIKHAGSHETKERIQEYTIAAVHNADMSSGSSDEDTMTFVNIIIRIVKSFVINTIWLVKSYVKYIIWFAVIVVLVNIFF